MTSTEWENHKKQLKEAMKFGLQMSPYIATWIQELDKEMSAGLTSGIQEKIITKVLEERKRQDAKWGEQNHAAPVWGAIIGEEYGEVCKAINEFGFCPTREMEEQIYTEAIHTMASCMAMIECIERQKNCERRETSE